MAELSAALAEASHSAISEALGGPGTSSSSNGARRAGGAQKRAKGGKRSTEELESLTKSLLAYVKRNPGNRIEQVGRALSLSTKDLVLPAKKLIAEKKLATKGQKRATTYFAK